jgi:hypothetical protein
VYSLPPLKDTLIDDIIRNPYETKSDSFYFVNGELIMHNKASYEYFREDAAQDKKSYEDKFAYVGSKASKPSAPGAASKTVAPGKVRSMSCSSDSAKNVEGTTEGMAQMDIADSKETSSGSSGGAPAAKANAPAKGVPASGGCAKAVEYF